MTVKIQVDELEVGDRVAFDAIAVGAERLLFTACIGDDYFCKRTAEGIEIAGVVIRGIDLGGGTRDEGDEKGGENDRNKKFFH